MTTIMDMPLGRVIDLAEAQLNQGRSAMQTIQSAAVNHWGYPAHPMQMQAVNSPYGNALLGLGFGIYNYGRRTDAAAQYKPPYVRRLTDAELDDRFAKLTIDLTAKRRAATKEERK